MVKSLKKIIKGFPDIIQRIQSVESDERTEKERIIERLLTEGHINVPEATILMRTIDLKIEAESIDMSSGAKIVGGSDFEQTDLGR